MRCKSPDGVKATIIGTAMLSRKSAKSEGRCCCVVVRSQQRTRSEESAIDGGVDSRAPEKRLPEEAEVTGSAARQRPGIADDRVGHGVTHRYARGGMGRSRVIIQLRPNPIPQLVAATVEYSVLLRSAARSIVERHIGDVSLGRSRRIETCIPPDMHARVGSTVELEQRPSVPESTREE